LDRQASCQQLLAGEDGSKLEVNLRYARVTRARHTRGVEIQTKTVFNSLVMVTGRSIAKSQASAPGGGAFFCFKLADFLPHF
jgi:hypothetical protein